MLASACGGGGGGGPGTPVPNPAPPQSTSPPAAPPPAPAPSPTPVCETRGEFTLCVTLRNSLVSPVTVGHMKEQFFGVYPRLVERFNRAAIRTVNFDIGPSTHIAGASGDTVTYQASWLIQNPDDYDVVVHEIMHIVQNYASAPGWITEGIADYVRHYYGVNNAAAGWHLQPPVAGSSHTNGYGVAARFFIWIEQRHEFELVELLDASIRGGSYQPTLWVSYTGHTVEQLWAEYVADPSLPTP
jgi:hypothetical protein